MRFKIDENLPNDVATVLTRSGHDVSTVFGQGLVGAGDDTIGDVSQREGRVLAQVRQLENQIGLGGGARARLGSKS